MKIVVNGRFSGRKTGVGRVIENLFDQLQHLDDENEYFIYVNKEFVDFIDVTNPRFHVLSNGITAGNSLLNHLWTQTGFLYNILKHRADMVILPQINLFLFKLAPTILFQYDLIEYHVPNQKWYKMLFRKMTFPVALNLADKIVCIAESGKNDVEKVFGIPDGKISVVYCGVDTKVFTQIDTQTASDFIRRQYDINDKFILFTGTLTHPQKNLIRLVEAYRILVDKGVTHKLVLVGGKGKDADLIIKRIDELQLAENVIISGYVPDEDLPYFYSAASLFCFPSLYEGFGIPVLEAMACGCPVVTSNTSSLPEVAGDAALLVDPYKADEIAEGLYQLVSNEQVRNKCIINGFQQVRKFTWDRAGRQLLDTIHEVARQSAAYGS